MMSDYGHPEPDPEPSEGGCKACATLLTGSVPVVDVVVGRVVRRDDRPLLDLCPPRTKMAEQQRANAPPKRRKSSNSFPHLTDTPPPSAAASHGTGDHMPPLMRGGSRALPPPPLTPSNGSQTRLSVPRARQTSL